MTFTYKFYDKAEDAKACDIMSFEGSSEKDVREAVHEYCDIYGYEAYVLIPNKDKAEKPAEPAKASGATEPTEEPTEEPTKQAEKKVWTEEEIKSLVQTKDKVLYGALKKLYAEQTADEQNSAQTTYRNGAGFNSVDAKFLTSTSEFLLKTGFLTSKQKAVVRRKLVKYNKQLTRLANA